MYSDGGEKEGHLKDQKPSFSTVTIDLEDSTWLFSSPVKSVFFLIIPTRLLRQLGFTITSGTPGRNSSAKMMHHGYKTNMTWLEKSHIFQ